MRIGDEIMFNMILNTNSVISVFLSNDKGAGLIFFIIIIVIILSCVAAYNWTKRHEQDNETEKKKVKFFKECVREGVDGFDTEKNRQKAILIAQKYKLEFASIEDLYSESKKLSDDELSAEIQSALNKKKNEETIESKELELYSEFYGRDKRVAMLTKKYEDAQKSAEALSSLPGSLISSSTQKEMDWAVHGGIASGIAGPAAGLATAMDIQQKNAQIRQQNQENRERLAPLVSTSIQLSISAKQEAKWIGNSLEQAKTKLVSDMLPDECLNRIDFSNTTFTVTDTGTIKVTANAKLKSAFTIFEDVNAVIDGTVIAQIYDGDVLIGEAKMVLPTYGLNANNYEPIVGMKLFCGEKGKPYLIFFKPYKLWAMEK